MSKILLVEDEPDTVRMYRDLLESEGYDVLVAEDGEEALAVIDVDRPDLILLDLLLPGMDGIELARRLAGRDGQGRIPIVVVTCLTDFHDDWPEVRDLKAIRRVLYKPCRPKALLDGINDVLRRPG
jgi:DNA-binding response OmpR family regulator